MLAALTGALAEKEYAIDLIIETVTRLDILFARAKYSREIKGVTPIVNKSEYINIKQGRHPLLTGKAVPLDFELGKDYRGLVITGANAGGKTVVLKTVGLLTLMGMFGLQVPADEGTELAVFDGVFVDIGDQQNIENALSTFSGHMHNIAAILGKIKRNTLVLLDEIGSGTELWRWLSWKQCMKKALWLLQLRIMGKSKSLPKTMKTLFLRLWHLTEKN